MISTPSTNLASSVSGVLAVKLPVRSQSSIPAFDSAVKPVTASSEYNSGHDNGKSKGGSQYGSGNGNQQNSHTYQKTPRAAASGYSTVATRRLIAVG